MGPHGENRGDQHTGHDSVDVQAVLAGELDLESGAGQGERDGAEVPGVPVDERGQDVVLAQVQVQVQDAVLVREPGARVVGVAVQWGEALQGELVVQPLLPVTSGFHSKFVHSLELESPRSYRA